MTDIALRGVDGLKVDYLALVRRRRMYSGLLLVLFVALLAGGFGLADSRNAGGFWGGLTQIFDFPVELMREAIDKGAALPANLWRYLPAMIETINIAAVSTLLGAVLAVFLSLLSTRGLARWPRLMPLFRRVMDTMRAIPEIVIALVLIFVLGGGPVPAMIAIAFHTAGALGKLFSEVNENADLKPIEGLSSVGASWFQRIWLGVLPQVMPNYLSYALLRFEINVRASAILGFVGAGGIGAELRVAISWGTGRYDAAAAIFLLLFLTIVAIDQLSSHVRNRLVGGH
ncbi:phosphonate ABC transporter, permease protein PhnE [Nitratireductor sp. CAU 1489]|uniref:Phosphonate ABC transporter, permease protein PhnE n=1 Tax=Nitratireductor arenosus TaxID=2682096 RepID=A0A844QBQ6_9HYPH|nr:phosphonate ABC transporter, permease protein PhnE [Nitratireductor arenosus]MVA96685.1 phosphonate ABC transporter, permease protein PhnE [Nitratireductor arenosus]